MPFFSPPFQRDDASIRITRRNRHRGTWHEAGEPVLVDQPPPLCHAPKLARFRPLGNREGMSRSLLKIVVENGGPW